MGQIALCAAAESLQPLRPPDEVFENFQTQGAAPLRMKLTSEDVVAEHAGDEAHAVTRPGGDDGLVARVDKERMHKVQPGAFGGIGDSLEEGNAFRVSREGLIPAHVRNLQPIPPAVGHCLGKRNDISREPAQAPGLPELSAALKKHLESQTNPKKRLSRPDGVEDGSVQTRFPEIPHAVSEGPDARKDDGIRQGHLFRTRHNPSIFTDRPKSVLDAPEIAHSVIDDDDFHSAPFVDGTPSRRGSGETASRRALPNPLKTDSTM